MKVRIFSSSLRFRLSQDDVQRLSAGEHLETKLNFLLPKASSLRMAIESVEDDSTTAHLFPYEVVVRLSPSDYKTLSSSKEPLHFTFENGAPERLKVTIEKDLGCFSHAR